MLSKRNLLLILTGMVILTLVAACGGAAPQAPAPAEEEAAPAEEEAAPAEEEAAEGEQNLLDKVLAEGLVRVSTDPNYAPQSLLKPDGTFEGFDISVATEIANRLGVDIEFVTPEWDSITAGNWGGQWDMSVGSMTITKPRAEALHFSEGYYFTPAQFAARAGAGIETLDDVAGKAVCVGTATTYETYLNGEDIGIPPEHIRTPPPEDVTVVPLSTDAECAQSIQAGREEFDIFLTSGTVVDQAIANDIDVVKVGDPVYVENLAAAFDKNSPLDSVPLRDRVSEIILEMHEDGTLSEFSKEWFDGVDLTVISGARSGEVVSAEEEAMEMEVVEGCDDPLGCVTVAPDDPIRIASAMVIAGPNETLGIDSQTGVEIAIQDRGQVAGHALELQTEDAGCSAEGGQTAATKIASDQSIVGVIGHNCSSSCTPAAPIYNDAGMIMISPSCTAPALTAPETHIPSFLRTCHNDQIQGRVMAEYVYNELGLRTAATIHDGSPYAEQLQQVFADRFTELGGEITAQEAVNVGDTDMRPVLTSIASGEPEFLYYPIFIAEGAFITSQAREIAGLEDVVLAGADGMTSPDFLAAAGEAAEGMYLSGPDLAFSGQRYEDFKADYKDITGQDPFSPFHAHAYDATHMLFNAIEDVAKQDADGNLLIGRQDLRDALYETEGLDGITGTITCDANGDCADPQIAINQVQDGEFVRIFGGQEG
jgi:branched-chain amino acid transport system substrate-binding protein